MKTPKPDTTAATALSQARRLLVYCDARVDSDLYDGLVRLVVEIDRAAYSRDLEPQDREVALRAVRTLKATHPWGVVSDEDALDLLDRIEAEVLEGRG
jgi:hypothetical protein